MDFAEMIDKGAAKCGGLAPLGAKIGVQPHNLSSAKAGRRGIPDEACALLAQLIGLEYGQVSAARNAALAKDPQHRDFWRPFVEKKAAQWIMTIASSAIIGALAYPAESRAATTFMTPASGTMYIM